jgi:hypothetical protein
MRAAVLHTATAEVASGHVEQRDIPLRFDASGFAGPFGSTGGRETEVYGASPKGDEVLLFTQTPTDGEWNVVDLASGAVRRVAVKGALPRWTASGALVCETVGGSPVSCQ